MSSVSAETVRMRLMPSRYVGDMCSRPSMSLPDLMRWSVVASVFSSSAIFLSFIRGDGFGAPAVAAQPLEVAAAAYATVLAQEQLRAEDGDQLAALGTTERAAYRLDVIHATSHTCASARST